MKARNFKNRLNIKEEIDFVKMANVVAFFYLQ